MLGASASEAGGVFDSAAVAVGRGLAALVWSDGSDVLALIADQGENASDVRRFAVRALPEVLGE